MSNLTVTAHRWSGGWELHHDSTPITQVRTLDKAITQVRDYLDTVAPDIDHSHWIITVELGDPHLNEAIYAARAATANAATVQLEAAQQSRAVVNLLRQQGLSVTDTATLLGVSRGRVSQLTI